MALEKQLQLLIWSTSVCVVTQYIQKLFKRKTGLGVHKRSKHHKEIDAERPVVSDDYKALEQAANRALEKIYQWWGLNNELTFNKDKTEAIVSSNRYFIQFLRLVFNGSPITIK